jgi:putative ABC transport system permease protein
MTETVLQDLRYGARMLTRSVGFTAAAVFALALGIGVNATVLTAYKAGFARPLEDDHCTAIVTPLLGRPR